MSFHDLAPASSTRLRAPGLAVQRQCACGTHAGGGECEACRRKRLLQRSDRAQPAPLARAVSGAARSPAMGADLSGVATASGPRLSTAPMIQRQGMDDTAAIPETTASPSPAAEPAPAAAPSPEEAAPSPEVDAAPSPAEESAIPDAAGPAAESASPETTAGSALLAEDGAAEPGPGQMRKTEFLDQLQSTVCARADAVLAASGRSTEGCPYLERWFGYYRGRSAPEVESALRRYAPETRNARTAAEYIPLVAARVEAGVRRWATTGEISGVPDGLPAGMAALGGAAGALGSVGSALGGLFFKAKDGGARAADDPAAVRQSLGAGQPLESGVRTRMERAFGQSFAHVRTHTDANAGHVSARQNARAFTVGSDVAFGSGEYRPGTMVGDALIAHELAHVVQQGGASPETQAKSSTGAAYDALERDADDAAVGAVSALWGGMKGAASAAGAGLKSGLRLQRCSSSQSRTPASNDLAALCDQPKCLARSGCTGDSCKAEAKVISDTYVKRVAAIRRPDMPNRGDIHWGWMCYQWAGLLKREFEKLTFKCWQIRWVGIVSGSTGNLDHNYIFVSLGDAANDQGPVRDCGLILDPWRTGTSVVYTGDWDWHKWNYIHDTRDNTGKVYQNGKWTPITYPPPWTPDEPAPRGP